jgi:hypothetical protein
MRHALRGFPIAILLTLAVGVGDGRAQGAPPPPAGPTAPAVSPEASQQAAQLTAKANPLLYLGKYDQAIALYLQALKLHPKLPGAWRNLGLAYEGTKEWQKAIDAYEKYLEIAGTASTYSLKVMARVNECRKALGLPPKVFTVLGEAGKLDIKVSEMAAAIAVDGVRRGASPTPAISVPAGVHEVTVTKVGFLKWSKSVAVKAGDVTTVVVMLEKDPSYVPPRRVEAIVHKRTENEAYLKVLTPAAAVSVVVGGREMPRRADGAFVLPTGAHVVEVRAEGRAPWRVRMELVRGEEKLVTPVLAVARTKRTLRYWGWVTLGVAGVMAGAGAIFGGLEDARYEAVRDRRADTREALAKLMADGKRYRGAAIGCFVGAAAVLAGSIALFALERKGEYPASRLPLVIGPTERGAGLAVSYSGEVDF